MSPQDLTPRALGIINEAQVLAGGRRLLDYFPDHPAPRIVLERTRPALSGNWRPWP